MSDLFHSTDFGGTWETVDFRRLLGGNAPGHMSSGRPLIRRLLNGDVPARSSDGGATWTSIRPIHGRSRSIASLGIPSPRTGCW